MHHHVVSSCIVSSCIVLYHHVVSLSLMSWKSLSKSTMFTIILFLSFTLQSYLSPSSLLPSIPYHLISVLKFLPDLLFCFLPSIPAPIWQDLLQRPWQLRQLQQEEDKACLCVKQQQQQQQQEEQQKVEACLPAGPHTSPDTKRQLLSDLEDALSRPNQMPSNKNTLRLLATPNARCVVDGSTGWIMLSKVRYWL